MRVMINRTVSVLYIAFIALTSILFFGCACIIWLLTKPFDRRLALLHQFTSFWATLYLWTMPAWSIKASGRRKINKNTTYMVVSNHQSQLDILVAFSLFFHFKWVSKAEVFKLPLIGWNMVLNGYVKIRRGDRQSVENMMRQCETAIAEGNSVFFFPEGTRSRDGRLKPFKPGAFILARKMKVPILPIAINGSKNALPKHSINFHGRHPMRIHVLDEIPYARFEHLSVEETAELARQRIMAHVDEHRQAPEQQFPLKN
jgi:1-acyl-sn-glycerol-3-phosphate acyltransferase